MTNTDSIALLKSEARLRDHLTRAKVPWYAGTHAGPDTEDRRPLLRVYAAPGKLPDALAWVASNHGEWQGFRLAASQHSGR